MNEDAVPIPQRFQLRNDAADERHDSRFFAMRSFPANSNAWDKLWVWRPRGSRLDFVGNWFRRFSRKLEAVSAR